MTPEERANEVCRLFGIQPAGPDEGDWPHRLQARMAKAIRAAEDDARAPLHAEVDRLRDGLGRITGMATISEARGVAAALLLSRGETEGEGK